ncbi:hypothetical protein [Gulosibacter molinativorax]|nr:hypothetical protein [Gulosibacter molinativorax]QUY60868.1 Hypotetical protein [Gulosibacter molinativorax]
MATTTEMETTITYDHAEQKYRVWSSYRPHISRFKKDERARLTGEGEDWASFEIPASQYDIRNAFKRKVTMSDEQREAAAERLRKARAA